MQTRVGLTGGIGSGKSEVARMLASYGAIVVDADALAREALEPGTPGLARVVEEFGPGVLRADGTLDRSGLGDIVFSDPARLTALNAIVHPYVARRSAELMRAAPADAVVVYDVPLLVENQLEGAYDVVVVVDVSPATQMARLVDGRGLSEAEVHARLAVQATREQRRAAADVVLANDGDRGALERQVAELWQQLLATDQVYAGVSWRLDGDEVQVLLVLAHDGRWLFPKGHREPSDDGPADTVRRELAEEAGVRGEVGERPFATFTNWRRDGTQQRVTAFLVKAEAEAEPEEMWRTPTWCGGERARQLLSVERSGPEREGHLDVLGQALDQIERLLRSPA